MPLHLLIHWELINSVLSCPALTCIQGTNVRLTCFKFLSNLIVMPIRSNNITKLIWKRMLRSLSSAAFNPAHDIILAMESPKLTALARKTRRRDICREYYARHAEKLRAKAKLRMREYVSDCISPIWTNRIILGKTRHRERVKAASLNRRRADVAAEQLPSSKKKPNKKSISLSVKR